MIRFLFRFIGFWLLAGGFVALIVDGTRSIAASALLFTSAGEAWFILAPDSLAALEASTRATFPALWEPGLTAVLSLPAFFLLAFVGIVFLAVGRVREHSRFEAA